MKLIHFHLEREKFFDEMHERFNENEQALNSIGDALTINHERLKNFTPDIYDWYFERWVRKLKSSWITKNEWTQLKDNECNICFEKFQINQRIISLS